MRRWMTARHADAADHSGQALVEFSLVLPILLLLLMGIFEFGWVYMGYLELIHAGREGVRFASVSPYDESAIVTHIQSSAERFIVIKKDTATFDSDTPAPDELWVTFDAPLRLPGETFTIRLKGGISLITPVVRSITGIEEFVAGTRAVMRIE